MQRSFPLDRSLTVFFTVAVVLVIVFQRASIKFSGLEWLAAATVLFICIAAVLINGYLLRSDLVLITLWITSFTYLVLVTPIYHYSTMHFRTVTITAFIHLFSITVLVGLPRDQFFRVIIISTRIWIIVTTGFLLASFADLFQYRDSFSGIYTNRNNFAITSAVMLAFVRLGTEAQPRDQKTYPLEQIALSLFVVISLSLTGLIALFVVIFFPVFHRSRLWRKMAVALGTVIAASLLYALLPPLQHRVDNIIHAFVSPSSLTGRESPALRLWLLINGFELFLEKPLFGVGLGNSVHYLFPPSISHRLGAIGRDTHNNVLEMALGGGFPLLLLHYIPFIRAYKRNTLRQGRGRERQAALLVLYLLIGLFTRTYQLFSTVLLYHAILHNSVSFHNANANANAK